MTKRSAIVTIVFAGACSHAHFEQGEERLARLSPTEVDSFTASAQAADVSYYSDYFSFVGKDEHGFVAFAIDCNRGKAGDDYQADQFVAMHDESAGFVEIPGTGRYPNTERALVAIPRSEFFDVEGSAAMGFRIASRKVDLSLTVEPITQVTGHGDGSTIYSMRVAPGTLRWKGRLVKGRVIVEYLVSERVNKYAGTGLVGALIRNAFGGSGFQGLYLMTDDGRDVYAQNSDLTMNGLTLPKMIGFAETGAAHLVSSDLHLDVTEHKQGPGLFRWPVAWRARAKVFELYCRESSHLTIKSWLVGGFAMGIVEGIVTIDGVEHRVYGWSEVIR